MRLNLICIQFCFVLSVAGCTGDFPSTQVSELKDAATGGVVQNPSSGGMMPDPGGRPISGPTGGVVEANGGSPVAGMAPPVSGVQSPVGGAPVGGVNAGGAPFGGAPIGGSPVGGALPGGDAAMMGGAVAGQPAPQVLGPLMTEIQLSSPNGLTDMDGDSPPWLELFNPHDSPIGLNGLTIQMNVEGQDDAQWALPPLSMAPRSFLIVFLSGKDRSLAQNDLHASFRADSVDSQLHVQDANGNILHQMDVPAPTNPAITWGLKMVNEDVPLIDKETNYKWHAANQDIPRGWDQREFDDDDLSWKVHKGGLGIDGDDRNLDYVVLADSEVDFSGQQGRAGWSYGSWPFRNGVDYVWGLFEPFPNDRVSFGPRNFWQGDSNRWTWGRNDPLLPLYIEAFVNRPSSLVEGGLRGVIRRWTSNHAGEVQISGFAKKLANGGDGVRCEIHVQGENVWSKTLVEPGETAFDLPVTIKPGDRIDFTVDPGNGENADNDDVTFTAQIRSKKPFGIAGPKITSSTDNWSAAGQPNPNGWTYGHVERNDDDALYDPDTLILLGEGDEGGVRVDWDAEVGQYRWQRPDDSPQFALDRWSMRPLVLNDVDYLPVRRWTSTVSGAHWVKWSATKLGGGGDGVRIHIFHNGAEQEVIQFSGARGLSQYGEFEIRRVQIGDMIDIIADPQGSADGNSSHDRVAVQVSVHRSETLSSFVHPPERDGQIAIAAGLGQTGERGALLRYKFDGTDVPTLYGGRIQVRADDGFAVRLNGTLVGESGLSKSDVGLALWNRPRRLSPRPFVFQVDEPVSRRTPEDNVLTFEVYDSPIKDDQFLAYLTLDGLTVQAEANVAGFLGAPSPSAPNLGKAGIDAGPEVSEITPWIIDARDNRDLTVEATVSPRAHPITSVQLLVQFDLGAPMAFDMIESDALNLQSRGYQAIIDSGFLRSGGLVRWSILASDASGRTTIEPPLDETRYGAVIDSAGPDGLLYGYTFERFPSELAQEGSSEAIVWLGGEILRRGWLVDRRTPGQTKPNLIIASDGDETLNMNGDKAVLSRLVDLMAPVDDPTGTRALIGNALERELVGSGSVIEPLVLRRNGEFYGLFQATARIGWGDTHHLGLGEDPAVFAVTGNLDNRSPRVGVVNSGTVRDILADLVLDLGQPDDETAERRKDDIDWPHLINHLALRFILGAAPCCDGTYHLGYNRDNETWRLLPGPFHKSLGLFPDAPIEDPLRVATPLFYADESNRLIAQMSDIKTFSDRVRRRARTLFDQYLDNERVGRLGDDLDDRVNDYRGLMIAHADEDRRRWPDFNQSETFSDEMNRIRGRSNYLDNRRTWVLNNLTVPVLDDATLLPQNGNQLLYRYRLPNNDAGQLDWKEVDYDDSDNTWRDGLNGLGFERSDGLLNQIQTNVDPFMPDDGTSMYVRYRFEIDDPTRFSDLVLRLIYNDGFVAYLNGEEIGRAGYVGDPSWNGQATYRPDGSSLVLADVDIGDNAHEYLRGGINVLAIAVINENSQNDNLLLSVELTASERRAGTPSIPPSNQDGMATIADVVSSNGRPGFGYISIQNETNAALDLSHWRVSNDDFDFMLPAGTVALANDLVYIAADPQAARAANNIGESLVVGGVDGNLIPEGQFELTAP